MKKIYLASPFFSKEELTIYKEAIKTLRQMGYEVYVPQEHEIVEGWDMPNDEWAYKVFAEDVKAIDEADVVMVLNHGMYSDSGTAWEAGYAYAKDKCVINVIWGDNTTYSLMMMNGADGAVRLENIGNWEEVSALVDYAGVLQQ